MNNKGFAITTILYGTLILFLMLLLSMLGILSTYKDRLSMLIDSSNGARAIISNKEVEETLCGDINQDGVIDSSDLVMFDQYLNGEIDLPAIVLRNANFDEDGDTVFSDYEYLELHLSNPTRYPLSCVGR